MRRLRLGLIVFALVSLLAPLAAFAQEVQDDEPAPAEDTVDTIEGEDDDGAESLDGVPDEGVPDEPPPVPSETPDSTPTPDAPNTPEQSANPDPTTTPEPTASAEPTAEADDSDQPESGGDAPAAGDEPNGADSSEPADDESDGPVVSSAAIEANVTLTITKQVTGGNGTEEFEFFSDQDPFFTLMNGQSYQVLLSPNSSFTFGELLYGLWRPSLTCDGGSFIGPLVEFSDPSFEVTVGTEDVSCTVTNELLPTVQLTLAKRVDGATSQFAFFEVRLSSDQLQFYPGFESLFDSSSVTIDVPANATLTLNESYPANWALTGLECTGATSTVLPAGPFSGGGTITTGDSNAECTLVNEPPPPVSLTVTKVVEGGDGSEAFDFNFGTETVSLGNGAQHTVDVEQSSQYTFTESQVDGWFVSGVECNASVDHRPTPGVDVFDVFVDNGPVECTITNSPGDDVEFSLNKAASDDPAASFDFYNSYDDASFSMGDGGSYTVTAPPGTVMSIIEFLPDGWVAEALECTGAAESELFDRFTAADIVVRLGTNDVACTLTNDLPPLVDVTVSKVADGATDTDRFDFRLQDAFGFGEVDSTFDLGNGESAVFEIRANTTVDLEELATQAGWVFDSLECRGATVDFESGSLVRLTVGEAAVDCIFTNVAVPVVDVTIIKEVDGDTNDQIFDFVATGNDPFSLTDGESWQFPINANSSVNLRESYPFGWQATGFECEGTDNFGLFGHGGTESNLFISAGDQPITCTVTNSTVPSVQLTIEKEVVGSIDDEFEFNWFADSNAAFLDGIVTLSAGDSETVTLPPDAIVYIDERSVAGFSNWEMTDFDCVGASSEITEAGVGFGAVQVFLGGDADVTCTFTNSELVPPTLVVTKAVAGADPYGGVDIFQINTPVGPIELGTGETSAPVDLPGAGFFSISEWLGTHNDANWIATDLDCTVAGAAVSDPPFVSDFSDYIEAQFLADWGDSVECTVTNQANSASLTITKRAEGATFGERFQFNLNNENFFDLANGDSAQFSTRPGRYELTEFPTVGWVLAELDCTGSDDFGIDGAGSMYIDIALDAQVVCEVVNEPIDTVTISVSKTTIGGGPDQDFLVGVGDFNFQPVQAGATVALQSNPGQIRISEFPPGAGWTIQDFTCSGADVTVVTPFDGTGLWVEAAAGAEVGCEVTNLWDPVGTITINKVIEGQDPADGGRPFPFVAEGFFSEVMPGTPLVLGSNGGLVSIREQFLTSWEVVSIDCGDDGDVRQTDPADGFVELFIHDGDEITCTFVNRPAAPTQVTIRKIADGSTERFDFEGPLGTFDLGDGESRTFDVTNEYFEIVELVRPGWDPDVTCTGAVNWQPIISAIEPSTDVVREGAFVGPATGEPLECVFDNASQPTAQLTLTKAVEGVDTDDSFNFFTPSGIVNLNAGDSITFDVRPGPPSRIFEIPGAPGWALADVECAGHDESTFAIDPDPVSGEILVAVAEGGAAECTYTNERADVGPGPGLLTVVKQVNGVDPNPAVTTFDFSIDGSPVSLTNGTSHTVAVVNASTLFVEELVPVGWRVIDIACTGGVGTQLGPAALQVDVSPGDDITCTFVNEPAPTATLTLTKQASGGDPDATFGFSTPAGFVELAAGETTTVDITAGEGAIWEVLPIGWLADPLDCGGTGVTFQPLFFAVGIRFDVEPGGSVECVFTNVATPTATVNITKELTEGFVFDRDFTFETSAGPITIGAGETASVVMPTGPNFVFEQPQSGTALQSIDCDGGEPQLRVDAVDLFLFAGDVVNCTFVNEPAEPITVSLAKRIVGHDDGTAFAFDINGTTQVLQGGDTINFEAAPGTLLITESPSLDWELVSIDCDRKRWLFIEDLDFEGFVNAAMIPGDELNCEFVNTLRVQPETAILEIVKMVDGTHSGELHEFTDPNGATVLLTDGQSHVVTVVAGEIHLVSENVLTGWLLADIVCTGTDSDTRSANTLEVSVAAGDTARCTFVNQPPSLPPDPVLVVGGEPGDPDEPVGLPRGEFDFTYDAGDDCAGLTGTWTLRDGDGTPIQTGSVTDGSTPGIYTVVDVGPAVFDPAFNFSQFTLEVEIPCEGLPPAIIQPIEFIDPAGTIVDCVGDPIQGATVTLMRQNAAGVFEPVGDADGTVVDVTVRGGTNPILTDATGTFQWFTIAGNYRVDAELNGVTGNSGVLPVPPEQIDVLVELLVNCPDPKGTATPTPIATPTPTPVPRGGSSSGSTASGFEVLIAAPSPSAPSTPATIAAPPLAVTGAESRVLTLVGVWLFGAGALVGGVGRSKRRQR